MTVTKIESGGKAKVSLIVKALFCAEDSKIKRLRVSISISKA